MGVDVLLKPWSFFEELEAESWKPKV